MRISDWSSDVCSSDLTIGETLGQVTNMQLLWTAPLLVAALVCARPGQADLLARWMVAVAGVLMLLAVWEYRLERPPWVGHIPSFLKAIGRASCRERGCQYV